MVFIHGTNGRGMKIAGGTGKKARVNRVCMGGGKLEGKFDSRNLGICGIV